MKGMKKIVSLFLALVLSMSMMTISSFADEESTGINLKVTASTEETLKAGDELTAVLTAPAPADQFASCNVQMDFNKNILEAEEIGVTGINATSVTEPANANEVGKAAVVYAGANNITQTEDIVLTVKFVIKEGVYEDDYKDLITVNTEETYFTNADDEDLTVVFDEENLSYDASIAGLYKVKIPEGAKFTDMKCDVEDAKIVIQETGKTVEYSGNTAPLYRVLVPKEAKTVVVTFPRTNVFYDTGAYGSPCVYGYHYSNGAQAGYMSMGATFDDENAYATISTAFTEATGRAAGPEDTSYAPVCAFTFDILCDHSDVTHTDAVQPTCTESGNIEYWYCKDCERYYSDEKMENKIEEKDTVVSPLGHDFGEDGCCIRCGLRGDANVKFVGDGVAKVTDQSDDDNKENAGLDYTFKAGNAIVSSVKGYTVSDNEIGLQTQMFDQNAVTIVEDGTVEFDGKTIPNYTAYLSGRCYINGNTIDEDDSDRYEWFIQNGVYDANGRQTSIMAFNIDNFTQAVQYYVYVDYKEGRNWNAQDEYYEDYETITHDLAFGIKVVKGTAPDPVLTEMEADEDGVYTIPASEMKTGATVVISVEKPAFEKVEDQISAIGEVTLEKESAIVAAREAYDALSDEDKAEVSPKAVLRLENAESELALLKAKTDDNAAIIDEMIASMKKTEALINDLRDQIDDLKESGEADEEMIADLEDQLEDLQGIVDDLKEDAATKEELQAKISELNATITDLTNKINDMQTAAGTSSDLDAKKAQAAEEINQYLADNSANILPADLLETEIAALKSIIKANSAKDAEGVDAAVSEAKSAIDAKVQIKADTDAAKALKVKGLKAKAKSKKFTVSWKKNAEAEAYQVQYKLSSAKKFSNLKKSVTKVSVKSKKLKKGKKYIFQVRTIKTVNGKKVYGAWVKTKAVKCK